MSVMTHTFYASAHGTDEAALRERAQGIFDAFLACGWKQTDDTGQTAPSELTVPPEPPWLGGYMVFRLDDDLQSTAPVFVRFEFYRTTGSGGGMALRALVGSATDGAGNIVGSQYSPGLHVIHGTTGSISAEFLCYASGDGSSFNLVMYEGYVRACILSIERSRSASGIPTGESILVAVSDPSSSGSTSRVAMTGAQGTYGESRSAEWAYLPSLMPVRVNGLGHNQSWPGLSPGGGAASVFPVALAAPGVTPWVSSNLIVIHPADVAATSPRQRATINGAERTYRATTTVSESGLIYSEASSAVRVFPAILWTDEE